MSFTFKIGVDPKLVEVNFQQHFPWEHTLSFMNCLFISSFIPDDRTGELEPINTHVIIDLWNRRERRAAEALFGKRMFDEIVRLCKPPIAAEYAYVEISDLEFAHLQDIVHDLIAEHRAAFVYRGHCDA